MREHVREDARIHYVITKGGGQPNVVPADPKSGITSAPTSTATSSATSSGVKEIARGAALMTRTTLERCRWTPTCHEVLPNRTLAELVHAELQQVGPPVFTEDEKAFARKTAGAARRAFEKPLADGVEPMPEAPGQERGSTGRGRHQLARAGRAALNVASYTCGAPGHSWQVVACTGMSIGEKGMLVAAKTLAGTALELVLSPDLVGQSQRGLP